MIFVQYGEQFIGAANIVTLSCVIRKQDESSFIMFASACQYTIFSEVHAPFINILKGLKRISTEERFPQKDKPCLE